MSSTTIYAASAQSSAGIRFVPGKSVSTSKQEVATNKNKHKRSKNNHQKKFPKTNDGKKMLFRIIGGIVIISVSSIFLVKKGKKDKVKNEKSCFNSSTF